MANYDWDSHNRQVVLDGRAVLERTSASLARSNQIAIESEETGTSVINCGLGKSQLETFSLQYNLSGPFRVE